MTKIVLKKGREKSLLRGHPWIFSGAIDRIPKCDPGELLPIHDANGNFLAQGYFNPGNSLVGRILSFEKGNIETILKERFERAKSLREMLFDKEKTNAFRLINGEGDGIPGLIIDSYNGHLVMQVHTQGIEKLKEIILSLLIGIFNPKSIYEKSLSSARKEDGLKPFEGDLYKETPSEIAILEDGHPFFISVPDGQKTGFFLDQRLMRAKVKKMARDKTVLNCFSYTGGFSLYALEGGAKQVISVDSCGRACKMAEKNLREYSNQEILCEDVVEMDFPEADFIILDPPAFAKKKRHLDSALKAYQKIAEKAFRAVKPNGIILTSSCSYFVGEDDFKRAIFYAALKAGRFAQIIGKHIQAPDHPIALAHPEGAYLKSLLLFVH